MALNLTLTVVVTVPADDCVIVPVLEYAPLAIDISKPEGAVKTIVLFVVVNVPATVKVWIADAVPKQDVKLVKFAVLVIVPEPPA